ncbi:hypothetical protein ACFE04_016250 [Oxalis oulophora]
MDFKSTVIWMFVLVFPVAKIDAAFNKQIYKMNTDQTKIDEITRSFVFYKESALGKANRILAQSGNGLANWFGKVRKFRMKPMVTRLKPLNTIRSFSNCRSAGGQS